MSKKIAITGLMGAGKSTLGDLIKKKLKFPVFSSDDILDKNLKKSEKTKKKLVSIIGPRCVNHKGSINKKEMAKLSFKKKKTLLQVESLLHPLIISEIKKINPKASLVFFEVPLLFEKNLQSYFYSVITVACSLKTIEERMSHRFSKKEIFERLQFQFSQEQKILLSPFTLWNTGSKEVLFKTFLQLFPMLNEK